MLIYTKVGDYFIPDLILGNQPEKSSRPVWLETPKVSKKHHPSIYGYLLLSGKLWIRLVDIDTACEERMDMEALPDEAIVDLLDRVTVWPDSCLEVSLKFLNELSVSVGVESGTKTTK